MRRTLNPNTAAIGAAVLGAVLIARVEDVVPIVEQAPCPFLVTEKLTELGLYTPEQFKNYICFFCTNEP